jgi:hypothetical protein
MPREEFIAKFLARMPVHLARTFTSEQLEAIKKAFGSRYYSSHAFEFKRLLRLPWGRFYFVVLMGRDRRSVSPLADRFSRDSIGHGAESSAGIGTVDAGKVEPVAGGIGSR